MCWRQDSKLELMDFKSWNWPIWAYTRAGTLKPRSCPQPHCQAFSPGSGERTGPGLALPRSPSMGLMRLQTWDSALETHSPSAVPSILTPREPRIWSGISTSGLQFICCSNRGNNTGGTRSIAHPAPSHPQKRRSSGPASGLYWGAPSPTL